MRVAGRLGGWEAGRKMTDKGLMQDRTSLMEIDRAKGILFGLAIGDALGFPTEFMTLSSIKKKYGKSGITDLAENPALYTDDTQMSIALAEALVRTGKRDLESVMAAVREEFITWRHSPENNRAPGNTCLQGVSNMEHGVHWSESGVPDSKGCGAAMRVAPIGYFYQDNPVRLKEIARATAICTHGHRTSTAASAGAAFLVKLALDGILPENMIPKLLDFTSGMSKEFDHAIKKVEECLDWIDEEKALAYLGEGWVAEEAVALALFCFLRHSESFEETVIRGANTNGDSDSIASIAGGISGAYLGFEAIPDRWVKQIEKSAYLADLSSRLAERKLAL